jgi:hypothetical protein
LRRVLGAAICAATLTITGCSDDTDTRGDSTPVMPGTTTAAASPATSSPARGVLAPTDTGHSQNTGMDVMILSVEDVQSRYGPVTVFTFQLVNTGTQVFQGYNWPTPTLVYGPSGKPIDQTVSFSEGYGQGVSGAIPPGSRQTVKHAYKVAKSELNPAVVTAGSVLWQGDFSTFQR